MTRGFLTFNRILTIGLSHSELQSGSESGQAFNREKKSPVSNYPKGIRTSGRGLSRHVKRAKGVPVSVPFFLNYLSF